MRTSHVATMATRPSSFTRFIYDMRPVANAMACNGMHEWQCHGNAMAMQLQCKKNAIAMQWQKHNVSDKYRKMVNVKFGNEMKKM